MIDLDRIEQLAKAATEGPWEWEAQDGSLLDLLGPRHDEDSHKAHILAAFACESCVKNDRRREESGQVVGRHCMWPSSPDAEFITHMHPGMALALVERIRELEKLVALFTKGRVRD